MVEYAIKLTNNQNRILSDDQISLIIEYLEG